MMRGMNVILHKKHKIQKKKRKMPAVFGELYMNSLG